MSRIYQESFDAFTASGFSPDPSPGQLDSDIWRVVGLSDNANPAYGFTGASGGDFGRGLITTNDPTTAGVYAPASDHALVIQPTGAELDVNGFIEARIQNVSGATASGFSVGFDWVARNNATRSDNLAFSYSTDGVAFTTVDGALFSSGAAPVANAGFTHTPVTALAGVSVAPDGYLFLRWTHTGSTGAGNRDEVGIDNLTVDTTAAAASTGVSVGNVSITEGDAGTGTASFVISRSDTAGVFTVHYATADGTATAGSDYLPASGDLSFAAGGPASQTVSVPVIGDLVAEADESFTLNLSGLVNQAGTATLTTASATGTIVNDDVALTPIYAIQGSGNISPLAGQTVNTRGVVTAISNGSSKGFYLQDPDGDGDAGTSDGVFVFTGTAPAGIAVGDLLTVTGAVQEFTPSGAARGALSVTEISSVTAIVKLSGGNALPAAITIGTGGLSVPNADIPAANAFYERLEGMLVTVLDPLVTGPTNNFGEIFTVASGGAAASGLNGRGDLLISGGAASFGNTDTVGGDQNPERIQIDPGLGITNPTVSVGARLASVTGVVGYDFGDYQVLATAAPTVVQASPLTKDAATLTGDATHLLVGSYNAKNLDPGDGAARFAIIAGEIIGKLNAPDILALQEIQDNNGATSSGVTSASVTLQMIVDAVNAAGGPQYAAIDNPFIGNNTNGGEPGGNIRTAFLYRTDRVSFVAGSLATVAANGSAITGGTYIDQQTNPDNPFYASRPPLSASFTFNGQTVTVLSDHFTSKGGSAALYGSIQPPFDAGEVQRAAQAQAVNMYVDGLLAADPNARVIVAGDLNDFGFEQPLSVLRGTATLTNYDVPASDAIDATATYTPGGTAILSDLQDTLPADQRFDYVFEGNAETLDHMLVTSALAAGAAFQPVHINAEFFDQTSDHDPLVGLFAIPASTAIPTGNQPATFSIRAPGLYTLAAGTARTQTAGTGVEATVVSGVTTIDIEGTLTDTASGARALRAGVPSGQVTVGTGGVVQALDADAIQAQSANGRLDLLNLGRIISSSSIGAITPGTPGGANLPAAAYALNFNAAVGAASAPAADFTSGGVITNGAPSNTTALIRSDSGDAIRLGAHETLVNYGRIAGNGPISDSSTNNVFNNTSVAQRYDISRGVRINAATSTNDRISNFGLIEGAQHGVDVGNTAATNIVVDNAAGATILGHNGSGVGADTTGAPASTVVVTNAGTIRGEYAPGFDRAGLPTVDGDGDGVDVDGGATVINRAGGLIAGSGADGVLAGKGAGGFDSGGRANRSEGLSLGGGLVTNDGTISGADAGIVVNNDSNPDGSRSGVLATAITNNAAGVIIGQAGFAIRLENKGAAPDNDSITNYGSITGNGMIPAGPVLLENGLADPATIGVLDGITYGAADAGSARFIAGDGSAIQTGEGSDVVINYGTITGNTGRAINLEGGDDLLVLHTGEAISGRIDGGAGADTLIAALDDRAGDPGGTTGALANVAGFETLQVTGGDWTITDGQTYAAGISIGAGASLTIGGQGSLAGDISDAGTLVLRHADAVTLAGTISGAGMVVQDGTGTLTLAARNSYTGGTRLVRGTLDIGVAGAAGAGPIDFSEEGQTLALEAAALDGDRRFTNAIRGFGDGDTIDIRGIGVARSYAFDPLSGRLGLLDALGGLLAAVTFQGDFAGRVFSLAADANGGTSLALKDATIAAAPLKILLTNDDGYSAPGIQTLYSALVSAGFDVRIVAPAVNQSAQGSSLGGVAALTSPIAVTQFSPGNSFVDGRPATATLVGVDDLFGGSPPDLIISGTNRGDNIGESENISGTVNGALQGLFEGVPAIAVSAGSFNGSYDQAFLNSANFVVDFLKQLQAKTPAGQPILPAGEGLTINVPGATVLGGAAVTTVTAESSAYFPYAPGIGGSFAESFITNIAPSGSTTAEGSQFLTNHITISPIDGNWGASAADRDALAIRLGSSLNNTAPAPRPLNILLLDEDGANAPGITATRQALLARGYNVTVLAPSTDQSGIGSALFLNPVTVTQFDATSYAANGTPATLIALGLDPRGLFNGAKPDLVVVGADQGDAVGLENANHSATLAGAVTALFNYGVPSIAVSSKTGNAADLATGAGFVSSLIANLQATQGNASGILPPGIGLSVNVPAGASIGNYAFTTIDAATDANLGVAGDASSASFVSGGPVSSSNPRSEGNAFNAGKITVSPIDGNIAVRDPAAYDSLASVIGTSYGVAGISPSVLSFQVSEDAYLGDAQFLVLGDGHQIGGVQTVTASHAAGKAQTVTVLDYFDLSFSDVTVRFVNDLYAGSAATDRNLYVDKLTLNGAVFEGEAARNPSSIAVPNDAVLYSNGDLTFHVNQDTLVLRVSEDAFQGDAQFVVRADGVQIGGPQTVTASHAAGQFQDITLRGSVAGASAITVSFVNDLYAGSPGTDRNLYVDKLTLDGAVYQGESATNNAGTSLPTEAVLLSNGDLSFMTHQDTLVVRVAEDAYQGDAQFNVLVNGTQIGATQTATASHAAGQFQDIALSGFFGQVHNVEIDFVNDLYAGTPSTDRNLYVDQITLNGQVTAAGVATNLAGPSSATEASLMGNGSLYFTVPT